jgi:hypothetical protein
MDFCAKITTKRGLVLLVAGLWLSGQIAATAHLLTVRHVTCAEHGELVHADAAAPSQARRAAEHAVEAADAPAGHTHEHCPFAWQHEQRIELVAPPAAPHGAAVAASPLPASAPLRSARLYRVAPKLSPPV